ncbi:pseudouridine synthase [Virgibacillus halophilus]|uniref:Pseudouridine synthase n=1 Tax=Tigheibacillus halophilus TaxID=361280 RepID=A0ABU5CCM1_9BACI|nr:pseudouridine synthase [Virgibacillus halophilus]
MRLDKLLANVGRYGSRKDVKKILQKKRVTLNGETVKDGSIHVDPHTDNIGVNGESVHFREYIYILMNKPQNVISATEDGVHKTVIDLLDEEQKHFKPFPVGRLDKDTEGLLLLTNDGQLAHCLLSPNRHVEKTYFAKIRGIVTEEDQQNFAEGVILDDGYLTKPAKLSILKRGENSEIEITITEGKFHQVKRMFEAVGKKVVYLQRIRMGDIHLDMNLRPGQWRELTEAERAFCETLFPVE